MIHVLYVISITASYEIWKHFILGRILSEYPPQWIFALISVVFIFGGVCETMRIYFG